MRRDVASDLCWTCAPAGEYMAWRDPRLLAPGLVEPQAWSNPGSCSDRISA
jgi:hypothetical protein